MVQLLEIVTPFKGQPVGQKLAGTSRKWLNSKNLGNMLHAPDVRHMKKMIIYMNFKIEATYNRFLIGGIHSDIIE